MFVIISLVIALVLLFIFLDFPIATTGHWIRNAGLIFLAIPIIGILLIILMIKYDDLKRKKKPITTSENPKVDTTIKEAQELLRQLNTLSLKIKNNRVRQNALDIAKTSQLIITKLSKNPSLFSSLSRFFNYYLPTTIKLLTSYSYMENQELQGEHITNSMQKIDNTLDILKEAYKKQLDSLFKQTTLDLESDMAVLDQLLKKEGLTENDLDLKNFLDTEKQE